MSDIKIGSYNKSYSVSYPQKSGKFQEVRLKEVAAFLGVSDDYINIFSERLYVFYTVLKDAQGRILSLQSGGESKKVLEIVGSIRNFSYELGEKRFRTVCDRIEKNIHGNSSYLEDLHILRQELSQALIKIGHLYR